MIGFLIGLVLGAAGMWYWNKRKRDAREKASTPIPSNRAGRTFETDKE